MKKLTKIITCIALALISIVGLSGCTIEDIKKNTTSSIEATTSIVAREYSQTLAKDMINHVVANTMQKSYSMEIERISLDGSNKTVEQYTVNTYSYKDSTVMVVDYAYENVNGTNVSYYGKSTVAKLKDTTTGEEKYYSFQDLYSNEEQPNSLKVYSKGNIAWLAKDTAIAPHSFTFFMDLIKSGMCYIDGYSFLKLEFVQGDIIAEATYKIKDGLIYELCAFAEDTVSSQTIINNKYTFSYDIPMPQNLPETVQELTADGYVEGNVSRIIEAQVK